MILNGNIDGWKYRQRYFSLNSNARILTECKSKI